MKALTRIVVLLSVVLMMAVATTIVQGMGGPRVPSPYSCLHMDAMLPIVDAKHVVLVALDRRINGKLQDDSGLELNWFHKGKRTSVGMAHPLCWTPIAVRPDQLNYAADPRRSSRICVVLRNGNKARGPGKHPECGVPIGRFVKGPDGKLLRYPDGKKVVWTTLIYGVDSPAFTPPPPPV